MMLMMKRYETTYNQPGLSKQSLSTAKWHSLLNSNLSLQARVRGLGGTRSRLQSHWRETVVEVLTAYGRTATDRVDSVHIQIEIPVDNITYQHTKALLNTQRA